VDVQLENHRAIVRSISGLLLGTLVATLSTNILATALPRILPALHVSVSGYTWVVAVYVLLLTVSVPAWGRLTDLFDKKRLLETAFCIYMAGSIVAGCATSGWLLVAGRGMQGIGTGGLAAISQIVLAAILPPRQRGRYNGYSGAMFAIGTVSGPLVGGALASTPVLGWRACFFAPLPFGLLALYMIHRNLKVPRAETTDRPPIDLKGLTLIVLAGGLLVGWLSLAGVEFRWVSATSAVLLLAAAVAAAGFAYVETRTAHPAIRLNLMASRPVALASGASFICGAIAFDAPLFLAQLFQLGRGHTPFESGLYTLPMIAGIFTASWGIGRLITATGRLRWFLLGGALIQTIGMLGLSAFGGGLHGAFFPLAAAMFTLGVGIGILQQNVVIYIQSVVPRRDLGSGTAVLQFWRFLGGAVGVSALGAFSASRVASHVASGLTAVPPALRPKSDSAVPDLADLSAPARHVVQSAYASSFQDVCLVLGLMSLLAILALSGLREIVLSNTIQTAAPPLEEVVE